MKTVTLITAAALVLTTLPSFAQELVPAHDAFSAASIRTRADVQAELHAALTSGWRPAQGEVIDMIQPPDRISTLTRADAHAELLGAVARGERQTFGEVSPGPTL